MSKKLQNAKCFIKRYYDELDNAQENNIHSALQRYCSDQYLWRGFHPFNELNSSLDVAEKFWVPLRSSLNKIQRRTDIFMAGYNQIDDFESIWVCSMGHILGLFDHPWLGIQPTHKITMLRYCEFHKVVDEKITETAMFFDIPHLMMQAGLRPFPPQTGAHLVQPGPMTNDGVMLEEQADEVGKKTLNVINNMVTNLANWDHPLTLEEELALNWHDDMIWWGPAGIGSSFTIERYAKQHSGPFRASFKDRIFNGHVCKFAEGQYGGFFGWPNLTLTPTGGFMGMPATNKPSDMRVIDIYRRDGDKLAENWVFIDLLHFWKQQGVDILARSAVTPVT